MANADEHGVKVAGLPYYKTSHPPMVVAYDNAVAITASVAITFPNMKTIQAVCVTGVRSNAPALQTSMYTHTVSGNTVTVYAWKPTSSSNPTLIAADDATVINVIALGI